MKLKKLPVQEVLGDPRIIMALWNHFKYSIKDIASYEDLTQEEKEIIPKPLFQRLTQD